MEFYFKGFFRSLFGSPLTSGAQSGQSLVEVMVAGSIATAVLLGVSSSMVQMSKQAKSVTLSADWSRMKSQVQQIAQNEILCTLAFRGLGYNSMIWSPSTAPTPVFAINPLSTYIINGNGVPVTLLDTTRTVNGFRATSINLVNLNGNQDLNPVTHTEWKWDVYIQILANKVLNNNSTAPVTLGTTPLDQFKISVYFHSNTLTVGAGATTTSITGNTIDYCTPLGFQPTQNVINKSTTDLVTELQVASLNPSIGCKDLDASGVYTSGASPACALDNFNLDSTGTTTPALILGNSGAASTSGFASLIYVPSPTPTPTSTWSASYLGSWLDMNLGSAGLGTATHVLFQTMVAPNSSIRSQCIQLGTCGASAGYYSSSMTLSGNQPLGVGGPVTLFGRGESPLSGGLLFGDGTGWMFEFANFNNPNWPVAYFDDHGNLLLEGSTTPTAGGQPFYTKNAGANLYLRSEPTVPSVVQFSSRGTSDLGTWNTIGEIKGDASTTPPTLQVGSSRQVSSKYINNAKVLGDTVNVTATTLLGLNGGANAVQVAPALQVTAQATAPSCATVADEGKIYYNNTQRYLLVCIYVGAGVTAWQKVLTTDPDVPGCTTTIWSADVGTKVAVDAGGVNGFVCRFPGASCPPGWQNAGWSASYANGIDCGGHCGGGSGSSSHGWSQTMDMSCGSSCNCLGGPSAPCPTMYQIGCIPST